MIFLDTSFLYPLLSEEDVDPSRALIVATLGKKSRVILGVFS